MKKRREQYVWLTAHCHCGIKQLIIEENAAAHDTVCLVHSEKAKRWVPEAATLVIRALQILMLVLQDYFQELPVGTRDNASNFCTRMCFSIDLAFQVNNMLMAVEVHGGAEHVYDKDVIKRDKNKQLAWAEEVAQQSADASPRCVGPILVIWAPELVPASEGGRRLVSEWESWVHESVVWHVRQHMM